VEKTAVIFQITLSSRNFNHTALQVIFIGRRMNIMRDDDDKGAGGTFRGMAINFTLQIMSGLVFRH